MTVAVTIKVSDGVVLAADSAASMTDANNNIVNIYNNGNKIFNLHKRLPIGAATWGTGNIGKSTLGTIVKDFRKLIMSDDPAYHIDVNNYTVQQVADKFYDYLLSKYNAVGGLTSTTGFYVTGYSSNEDFPETWQLFISDNPIQPNIIKNKQDHGPNWQGQLEAINRIIFGFNPNIEQIMRHFGVEEDKMGLRNIVLKTRIRKNDIKSDYRVDSAS